MLKLSLIAAASLAALGMPAAAADGQRWSDANFMAAANVTVHRGGQFGGGHGGGHHDGNHHGHRMHGFPRWESADARDHRHHRGDDNFDGFGWGYYDADINRSWDPDSFNDWWHDRPDRAFPRWVRNNAGCDEDRMWSSGSGWRC